MAEGHTAAQFIAAGTARCVLIEPSLETWIGADLPLFHTAAQFIAAVTNNLLPGEHAGATVGPDNSVGELPQKVAGLEDRAVHAGQGIDECVRGGEVMNGNGAAVARTDPARHRSLY